MKLGKLHIYIYPYFLLLYVAAFFLFDFSRYNYIFELFFGLFSFILFPYISSMRKMWGLLCVFLLIEVATVHVSNIYYFITDFCVGLFLFFVPQRIQAMDIHGAGVYLKAFYYGSLFYIILILIAVFIPSLTVDGRFNGLGFSCNITSSIVLALCIFLYVYKRKISMLLFVMAVIFTLLYFAKTRALLFAFPLFIYYLKQRIGFKFTFIFLLPAVIFLISSYFSVLGDNLRLNADDSFNTRMVIYLYILDGLKASYYIIPHGFNVDQLYIDALLGEKGFPVHNDFLKYLYNYGIFFVIFLFFFYRQIKVFFHDKAEMLLIFLALSSNALQNALFSIYILIPFMFVLLALRKEYTEKVIFCCKNKPGN